MNTSMFLPQVQEDDVYDNNGVQADDVNSVVEYIEVALGYDKTSDDEDDDNGQNFHLVKNADYNFQQQTFLIVKNAFTEIKNPEFSEYKLPVLIFPTFDILTPPPNQA
jgi:hypothetical protein